MRRFSVRMKSLWLTTSAVMLFGFGGSCIPDNLWADIWGGSIITGVVEAVRNTILVGANLQTP